jgi:hypothetical protein
MKKERVKKVWAEIHRTIDAIKALDAAEKVFGADHRVGDCYHHTPKETGAVRRASLDLTRALAEMRKSDYAK